MEDLIDKTEVTISMMEKVFPPSFFDVMLHLPIYLVQQLAICGPFHTCWMYPVERYLKTLKDYVRQRAQPEGLMPRGYVMEEALGFCTEYMHNCTFTTRRVCNEKDEPCMYDDVLQEKGRRRILSVELQEWIHEFAVNNAKILEDYKGYVCILGISFFI